MRKRLIVTLLVGLWLVLAAGPLAAQTPGVYDRGWSPHAQGTVNGNMYTVVWGDTVFSIARRFGVAESTLMNTNGIPSPYRLQAGQPIIIPGLGPGPGPNPCPSPFLAITNPASGALVGVTFNVSGSGCGLPAGTVLIRALDSRGVEVSQVTAPLSAAGAGGQGGFNVTMTAPAAQGPTLTLLASSGSIQSSPVVVNVDGGGVGMCTSALLSIFEPAEGASVPATFAVRGEAGFNCTVTLTARDTGGRQLGAASAGAFQGTTWATTLALQGGIAPGTEVWIDARTNGGGALQRRVRFGSAPQAAISLSAPAPNASLPATFDVTGFGSGLGDGTVIIRAIGDSQGVLIEQPSSVGPTGQGNFTARLTVNLSTAGRIEAFNPATGARTSIPVVFNSSSGGAPFRDLPQGQCALFVPSNNVAAFTNPDGALVRTLPSTWFDTRRVVRFGGQLWYVIPGSGANGLDEWVRGVDVSPNGNCGL